MAIIEGTNDQDVLQGTAFADTILGYGGDDVLMGYAGADILNGGTGADTMYGGHGNDTYVVDNTGDIVGEYADQGTDIVRSSINYTLGANVEDLLLTGSALAGTGNSLDNHIYGNSLNNTLNGSGGADTLQGGDGNDVYIVETSLDDVIESANQGEDTVYSWAQSFVLDANVENLVLMGTGAIVGYGNSLDNELGGNSGSNHLYGFGGDDYLSDGGGGNDWLHGGIGNDGYSVMSAGTTVKENLGEGDHDYVVSWLASYTLPANVEDLILFNGAVSGTGNASDNAILSEQGAVNNVLDGGAGADYLDGWLGDDTYYVDNALDQVIESAGNGSDTVYASANYTLNGSEIEVLSLTAGTTATGNQYSQTIFGNAGNNVLDGGGGADSLQGGGGGDTYYVDNALDQVIESAGNGSDTVHAGTDYVLTAGSEVEMLYLDAGTFITGNGYSQTIFGNAGDNTLQGGGSSDTLSGLGGNDTFVFATGQANGSVVFEFVGNGAAAGDSLKFIGFGTLAQGASFTQASASEWIIHSGLDGHEEVITLFGAPSVDASDFLFV